MRRMSRMKSAQGSTTTTDTNGETVVTTSWMLAHGAEVLRVFQDVQAVTANWRSKAGYRFAQVRTASPGAWVVSATARSAAGQFVEDFNTAATTDQMWIQARVSGYASAAGLAEAQSRVQASLDETAEIVAARTVNVVPVPSGAKAYVPVSDPFVANDLTGVMAALVFNYASGTVSYGLAIRFFNDPDYPTGTWTDLYTRSSITATEEKNTGDVGTTPGTTQWAQLAVFYGGADALATIRAVASAKYGS